MTEDELGLLLRVQYGYWGEHPEYTSGWWRLEVSAQDTRLGYWEWVAHNLLEE